MAGEQKMRAVMKKDWIIMLISLLASIALWGYVSYVVNPEYETTIDDIEITYNSQISAISNGKLAIVEQDARTISIKIKGDRKIIAALNEDEIKAHVDFSSITKPGEYNLPISIELNNYDVSVVSKSKSMYKVVVEPIVMVPKNISVITTGVYKDGYMQKDDAVITPQEIVVTGIQREVDKVSSVRTMVDVSEADRDIRKNTSIQLCDANGKVLTFGADGTDLPSVKIDKVETSVYIQLMKKVPVKLDILNFNEDMKRSVEYEIIDNGHILIWGNNEIMNSLSEIISARIDAADISDGEERMISLIIPEGIESNFDASSQKIKVRFKVTQQ